jgi:Sulfotransferase family
MAKPVRPEPKFFLREEEFSNGRSYYENKFFANYSPGTRYFGEKSTSYIESPAVARRIREFYSDARILIILRDPVLRAWSNYRFSVLNGIESLDFERALAEESNRIKEAIFESSVTPYAYRGRGYYIDYIENYLKVFDDKQVYVMIFEEIVGNLTGVQRLYSWLGLDDDFIPSSLGQIFNSVEKEKDMPKAILMDLIPGYEQSTERLENYLGRPINSWRRSREALLS